ncbi:MAG: bifunctional DedA family/phosphatase PAP2 family protein [Candidatus Paceibacterota bacterium]|jgi:undecaprenyl-diphosphatase
MEHFFLNLFQTHPEAWQNWGYTIVFATAFIESILFIGIFIPGQIFIILAGFLVKLGVMNFWWALVAAAVGAIIGDATGFAIGKRYKEKLPEWMHVFLKKEHLEKTQRMIEKHSIKTIFVGRLHSMTRTLAPFAAGTTSVSFRKFFTVDIFAAIIWAFISLAIGYVFGKSFEIAAAAIGRFILIATIVTIALIILVKFLHKNRHRISWIDFSLYTTCAISIYLFAMTAEDIWGGKLFHILDFRIGPILTDIRTPLLTFLMVCLTTLGNPFHVFISTTLLAIFLLWKKRYFDALLASTTMAAGVAVLHMLKASFAMARPAPGLVSALGPSFPSGHAMMAIIFASVISYTLVRHIKSDVVKNITYGFVFTIAICIGFSRVYLNVHWASDVFAGFFAGAFFATFMIGAFRLGAWIINRSKRNHEFPNLP